MEKPYTSPRARPTPAELLLLLHCAKCPLAPCCARRRRRAAPSPAPFPPSRRGDDKDAPHILWITPRSISPPPCLATDEEIPPEHRRRHGRGNSRPVCPIVVA